MSTRDSESITRRTFVATTLAAGALLGVGAAPKPASAAEEGGPPRAHDRAAAGELEERSITELQAAMRDGSLTARALVESYRRRIGELDHELHAVLELNADALAIADALDAERRRSGARGPLHGIPILLKDNIATADQMETTAGSLALMGVRPPREAFIAQRLRAAGAVLLGKTNMSEWANFRSTHASSGWSGRGGQCRNPYALDRSPSGSSSGSAVATAANMCAAAIGTETNGSIVSPASACSLVGIKPTVGLVSRSAIIPISRSQDTAGPLARTVMDAAILLGAIAGADPADSATGAHGARRVPDYTSGLITDGLRGMRIGVPRERYFGYSTATDAIAAHALDVMRARGAVIVDPVPIGRMGDLENLELEVLLYEFKAGINEYLATLGAGTRLRTLRDLIAYNDAHAASEMPYFGQELFEQAERRGPLTDRVYRNALARGRLHTRAQGIDAVMTAHHLDALVAPTSGPPWLIDLVNGDAEGGGSSSPAAVAGYPSITVPAGYASGLPVGISFFGRAWSEATLLRIAHAYEQAAHVRRAPGFARTAAL
jgi:amidase